VRSPEIARKPNSALVRTTPRALMPFRLASSTTWPSWCGSLARSLTLTCMALKFRRKSTVLYSSSLSGLGIPSPGISFKLPSLFVMAASHSGLNP
jgi:hypothetical protein